LIEREDPAGFHGRQPRILQSSWHYTKGKPSGQWAYELKRDDYRAIAIRSGGKIHLRSRNNKDFNSHYPAIMAALASLSDETVIDWRGGRVG
jgi:ATP-dependent DNA ligase